MSLNEALRTMLRAKWDTAFHRLNGKEPGISGLLTLTQAWMISRMYITPRDIRTQPQRVLEATPQEVKEAFELLGNHKTLWKLIEVFVQDVRDQAHLITEEINVYINTYNVDENIMVIKDLIMRLSEWWKAWAPAPELGHTMHSIFNTEFQTHIFSVLPSTFPSMMKRLCEWTVTKGSDVQLWWAFEVLGILERYENIIATVCYERIEKRVHEMCTGTWNESALTSLRDWMSSEILPWMITPYAKGAKTTDEVRSMLQGIGSRFDYHVCKTLCDLRTTEIFDIIIDFPDSMPALVDLKECLQRVDQRTELVQTLRRLNQKRLLHPGADTKDILTQYVQMIRCLRVVDPPGVLLYKVADPVRRYLRERPDTIRSIMASLVGEGSDLVDENEPIQPLQTHVEDFSDPNWEPEAIDAGPEFRANKSSDVISTLVSIYDSKDLFVKELQVLLAQRLLAITDGNFEKERRNIEILKVRFGEAQLQVCEVMLRDMTDSRRIDQHVQAQSSSVLHPTVISKHFWPPLQSGKLNMPGQFKKILETYSAEYRLFKPDKKLAWLPQLGMVELSIELSDRTLEVRVPPIEAAVIELFSEREDWLLHELVETLSIDQASVRSAIESWIGRGVLREIDKDKVILLEKRESGTVSTRASALSRVVEEQTPTVITVQQKEAEQMRVYWKFIEGMLTNLGALGLDRIQTMLKFAPNYTRTIEQLAVFMEAARREGLVTLNNGLWRLNR